MVAVTVVIPTFNRSALLVQAVDSAVTQTVDDVEVFVVDDGSVDQTFTAASTRLIERKHRGRFAARRERHADLVSQQASNLWLAGRRGAGLATWVKAIRLQPRRAGRRTAAALRDRMSTMRG